MGSTAGIRSRGALALTAVVVVCASLAWGASEALAATTCGGTLHGRIAGPLQVPAGHSCKLAPGTVVAGKTSVVEGSLTADEVVFTGGVFATGAGGISIDHSSVGRSLNLTSGRGPIDLRDDTILGRTNLIDNFGAINIFGGRLGTLSCSVNASPPRFHGVSGLRAARARCVHASAQPPQPAPAPAAPPAPTSTAPSTSVPPCGPPPSGMSPGVAPRSLPPCRPIGPISA